jgi:hypothetical protein
MKLAVCVTTFYGRGDQTVDRDLPVDRGQLFGRSPPLFGHLSKFIFRLSTINRSSFGSIFLVQLASKKKPSPR